MYFKLLFESCQIRKIISTTIILPSVKAFLREPIELEKCLYRLDTNGQNTLSTFDAFIKVLGKLPGYIKNYISANPLKSFTAITIALGVAMGKIADRVYNAEKYAKKVLDKSAEKVDNVKSEIESLNSELQTTQNRIDELNAKENLTLVEREELERLKETNAELEREIRLKQSILSEEQKEANKDAKKYFTTKKDSLEYESSYEGVEIHEKTDYIGTVEERIEKLQQYADGQIKLSEETIGAYKDYVESALADFMEEDDYLVEGQDDGILARLDALYEKYDFYANGKASVTENKLKDILAKADFQSASKQLEELGKSGELSIATLSSRFPELIEYLKTAGISAEELYQYIMALSNSDTFNYAEIEKRFMKSLGFADRVDSAGEAQIWNEVRALGEEEVIFGAYLRICDQYGEHPEGWSAKDWIAHIQSELETELIEVETSLSISQTIDQLNTQLKPAFDSLKSAYQDIYDDYGKFDLQSIDILSTCDSIKSKLDELNKLEGITVDYSAFESLVQVLRNTESTEQDIETAFNSLATSITQAALSGAEDFETMKAALENLGVVNSEMVAFDALASNAEMLEQALSEATVSMDDFIVNTEDCSVEATKAGQAFLKEKVGTENCAEALSILAFHKELCNLQEMNTSREVANLKTLAENAGYTGEVIQYLTELEQIYQEVASGTLNFGQISAKVAKAASLKALIDNAASNINYEPKVDFSGATKSAKSAGKEAADAYLEAFQKEYDHLKAQSDHGEISEAQYLNALRSLYTRYFKDRKEYLDEFEKYESEYLSGMLDLHNKALSGISTLLNQKISAANDAKDEAISALEEEKEAAADAYQAQIDAIEEEKDAIDDLIKEKEKKIDALNEEADAIQRAAESRKKNIDLQKEEYNLERMLNQRTTAVYKEGEGFVYETDTTGIRDAREKVREAKESLEIDRLQKEADLIQKEIDLLEEKKDALTEEQDAIQKMLDASNMYYDNLIMQQENYWDSMIKNMEQQKSKWEELADIQQIAEAYSAVQQVFGELGYSVEDVLNGSESAFEDFKSRYISIMSDMNQNTGFQEGLEYASGVAKENFGSIVSNAQSTVQELSQTFSDGTFSQAITQGVSDGIVSAKQELDNMLQLGKDAGDGLLNGWDEKSNLFIEATKQTAIDAVEAFAEGQDSHSPSEAYKSKAVDAIDGLLLGIEENKQSFIDTVRTLAEEGVLAFEEGFNFENSTLNTSFDALKVLIESVTEALGIGTEGTVGGLLGALTQLSNFSFSEDSIIKQFNNLKTAIDEVTTAIGGGGESSDSEGQSGSAGKGSGTRGKSSKGEGSGGGSLTDAITSMGETAAEVIGEPDAEGDGTVIGEFGSLKTAVNNVTSAIGSGESEDGKGKGGGEPSGKDKKGETNGNLIGSIVNLGETTDETLGEPGGDGVIGRFEKFKDVIGEAAEHVGSIYQGLIDIDGKTVECTITVNVNQTGGTDIGGTVLGKMNLNSAAYTAKHGKALANGTGKFKGLPKAERNALVSEYGQAEMTVFPNGNTVITNGPTIMDLPKGTVIFNENQTAQLMRNKLHVGSASYTDRTTGSIQPSASEEIKIIPFQPSDKMYDYVQKWNAYFGNTGKQATALMPNSMYERSQQLYNVANQITNSRLTNKNQPNVHVGDIHITCPGVTSKEVAKQVGVELNHMFNGLHLDADQQSRLR